MSLSSLKRFLPKPPPRQVVLLSDALFFTRSVPVAEGATAADVAAQAELAVESLSPFPVAQLYYGHHWLPGSAHALVYAAYRKRLAAADVAMWPDAEAVLPSFVTVLRKDHAPAPATAVVVPGADSVTGLYFADAGGVPSAVRVESLPTEATDADRAAAREAVLAAFPEKLKVVDAGAGPLFDVGSPQGGFVFRAGSLEANFDAADVAPLDVRDKEELAARRRAHARDVILWRCFLGCAAAIGVAVLLEFFLVGASIWQKKRLAQEAAQNPVVEAIMTSQTLATRIDELSTKRLLPLEMLALVNTARPRTIQFMRTATSGLHTLEVEAQTSSSGDIDVLRTALNKLPGCEKAEVLDPRSRDGVSTFKLVVSFKPDALQQAPVPAAGPVAEPSPPPEPSPVPPAPPETETKPEEQT